MSEISKFEFAAPVTIGHVAPEELEKIASACTTGYIEFNEIKPDMSTLWLTEEQKRVYDASQSLWPHLRKHLDCYTLAAEINTGDVPPGEVQRDDVTSDWHIDGRAIITTYPEVLITDELPTQFAVGTPPEDSELADRIRQNLFFGRSHVQNAVNKGFLGVVEIEPYAITLFSSRHWHRSVSNQGNKPVARTFIRAYPATIC